jgi:hypothetical protein
MLLKQRVTAIMEGGGHYVRGKKLWKKVSKEDEN